MPYPVDLPDPGIELGSPALQVDSLPTELSGKPKNTGVGSLSLTPADVPDTGMKPGSPALQADSLELSYQGSFSIVMHKMVISVIISEK